MDKAEQKRLKKLGKEMVKRQSQELRAALATANPAPVGSDAWAANYRHQTVRERDLRNNPPDFISPDDSREHWVTFSVKQSLGSEFPSISSWFYECRTCGSLVHSAPKAAIICLCGNIAINPQQRRIVIRDKVAMSLVKLLAKAEPPQKPRNI